jgi:prepilin-type N-terminal cleavage/methylation domain-containing protein
MKHDLAATRGFTLLELMVVVSIISCLASVAFPQYQRANLRARAAERATIMEALSRAVTDVVNQQQRVPSAALPGEPSTWTGVNNPPGTPGVGKRRFDWAADGWSQLPMVVQGDAYYSYSFLAIDATGNGQNVTLTVTGDGDLDADGMHSVRTFRFVAVGFSFKQDPEDFLDPNVF